MNSLVEARLLPPGELNDAFLVVETALLEGRLLLSSDEHLRGIEHRHPASLKDFVFEHADRLPSGVLRVPHKIKLLFVAESIPPTSVLT